MRPSALFPFKTSLVVGAMCFLVVKNPPFSIRWASAADLDAYNCEFYPLSSFPMYSGFAEVEIYVFLTDDQDRPIRLHDLTNCQASALKKNYKGALNELKKRKKLKGKVTDLPADVKEAAGKFVLRDILTSRAPRWAEQQPQKIVRLHEGIITIDGGEIRQRTRPVAEGSLESLRDYQPEVTSEADE